MKINLINANSDLGLTINGSDKGPRLIENKIDKSKINKIYNINKENILKSTDKNDLKKNLKAVNNINKKIYDKVLETINENSFPITIGGDHSVAIGSALASNKNNNLGIIWLDAHLDYNTFKTTTTGNLHGLPLAAINGIVKELTNFYDGKHYNPLNTCIVGYRSLEDNREIEFNNAKEQNVTVFDNTYINNYGIKKALNNAIQIASKGTDGIHISFDIDLIDEKYAPGVSVPEKNGINLSQVDEILSILNNNKDKIKSFDLVEFNPNNDINNKTLDIACNIINKIIDIKTR